MTTGVMDSVDAASGGALSQAETLARARRVIRMEAEAVAALEDRIGDQFAALVVDLLLQRVGRVADPLGRRGDRQIVALLALLAVVDVDVHRHRLHAKLREHIVMQAGLLIPFFTAPFEILQIFGVVHMSVYINFGGTNHNV